MVTWVLRCKLYPEATPWRDIRSARSSRGGGWNLRAIASLDRWLSRQNPAYRPASYLKRHRSSERCFLRIISNYSILKYNHQKIPYCSLISPADQATQLQVPNTIEVMCKYICWKNSNPILLIHMLQNLTAMRFCSTAIQNPPKYCGFFRICKVICKIHNHILKMICSVEGEVY